MVYFYPCSNTNHVYNAGTYILLISTTFSFCTVFFFFSIINVNGPIPSLAFKTHFFAVGLFVEDPNINKGVFLHSRIVKNIVTIQVVLGCFKVKVSYYYLSYQGEICVVAGPHGKTNCL